MHAERNGSLNQKEQIAKANCLNKRMTEMTKKFDLRRYLQYAYESVFLYKEIVRNGFLNQMKRGDN
ncbi:hypothetical protein BK767_27505 [Bacillus thuringiensis serovar kyushuensis]|nr:hypothetical protein BK767_27505 [Bacillus thuringiensis serovar kyushuensis]OTZ65043.1 hypothetical protein BK768_27670 [Bacillus thuringiensis serovar tohokuensis]OUB81233.1 hypothetical protein BK773_27640 [Bacillus thuringiensis serovar indiana]